VARWHPDADGRLAQAALDLYATRGYEATTVAEIAAAAGVSERTFFRHFPDKREVLFAGANAFAEAILEGATSAPREASPLEVLARALGAVADELEQRRVFARRRREVITSAPELYERELAKLDRVATSLAAVLRERRVSEPRASVLALAGVGAFHAAFARWCDAPAGPPLRDVLDECFGALEARR
jgi:AcrR family transcriptional regulator